MEQRPEPFIWQPMIVKTNILMFVLSSIYEFVIGCYAISTFKYNQQIEDACGQYFQSFFVVACMCNIFIPVIMWLGIFSVRICNDDSDNHSKNKKIVRILFAVNCFQIVVLFLGNYVSDSCITMIRNNPDQNIYIFYMCLNCS